MAGKKVIAICQSGGEFETDKDGGLSYKGGDAHAMEIDDKMKYKDFRAEVAEMFNCNIGSMVIKYFLPSNKKTLITVSNDKDLKRMIKFHSDSDTAEIFVLTEVAVPETSHMTGSRTSRTTVPESVLVPIETAPEFIMEDVADVVEVGDAAVAADVTDAADAADDVDDSNQGNLIIDASFDIVGDTNHGDLDLDIPVDITDDGGAYDERISKATDVWKNNITEVGQRFNSVHEFREALRKYAIAHHFSFKYKKNDSHRVTVKCKEEGCPWRIHASRLSTTQLISIKKMNPEHKCDRGSLSNGYQATRSWVASIIKEKLRANPSYKPKDIVKDIKNDFGIQLNYFQAWRGKEIAKEQIQGSYKDAYRQLPYLCEKIMETNPGSLATFTTKENNSFHRLFVAFHASLYGFENGCRPLLFLDSLLLRSKYQGTLLTATAPDGNDDVFPVAFAVVDTESDDNWHWFLLQLKAALSTYRSVTPMVEGDALVEAAPSSVSRSITFVADREKGLKESIAQVFPYGEAYHAYCLRYLSEQLLRDLKGQYSHEVKRVMAADLVTTAYANKHDRFNECAEGMKRISLEAFEWLKRSEPEHWANALFGGARYNHMVSKFGEPFYSWVSDASELPITQMVDALREKIMELFDSRRTALETWETRLTPSMELMIANESAKTMGLTVYYHGATCEVQGDNVYETVDIDNGKCTCNLWQITGLPCCHALAVINYVQRDPYAYCSEWFTLGTYEQTYSESIEPVPSIERIGKRDVSPGAVTVTPPPTRRPPGRPTTRKTSQESMKRQLQCSRCKGTGHNKSTCKELTLTI